MQNAGTIPTDELAHWLTWKWLLWFPQFCVLWYDGSSGMFRVSVLFCLTQYCVSLCVLWFLAQSFCFHWSWACNHCWNLGRDLPPAWKQSHICNDRWLPSQESENYRDAFATSVLSSCTMPLNSKNKPTQTNKLFKERLLVRRNH